MQFVTSMWTSKNKKANFEYGLLKFLNMVSKILLPLRSGQNEVGIKKLPENQESSKKKHWGVQCRYVHFSMRLKTS